MTFGLVEWVGGGEEFWKRRKKIEERRRGSQPFAPVVVSKYDVGPAMATREGRKVSGQIVMF